MFFYAKIINLKTVSYFEIININLRHKKSHRLRWLLKIINILLQTCWITYRKISRLIHS